MEERRFYENSQRGAAMKIVLKHWLVSLLALVAAYADTTFADPKPSFDNPRKIVFSIIQGDDTSIDHVIGAANNVLKFYGPENVNMRIVAYSKGIRALLKKDKFVARIDTLMQYDVSFVACGNTMRTLKIKNSDLLDDVEVVTAGIVEIIEREKEGWIYIKP